MRHVCGWMSLALAAALVFLASPASFSQEEENVIDKTDLFLLADEWQTVTGPFATDFDNSGAIDQMDILLLISNYGGVIVSPTDEATPTPAVATPTPGSASPTPVPTETPIPTFTPVPTVTPAPTAAPGFIEFCANFDDVDEITAAGFTTYDESTISADERQRLVDEGRIPEGNELVPWFLYDSETMLADDGIAQSDPHSAAFNSENLGFFSYFNNQTSILEINQQFNTAAASVPRIRFDIAYDLEQIRGSSIRDFLVVETFAEGDDQWRIIDLNNDGEIVDDLSETRADFREEGSFDGVYDTQLDIDGGEFVFEKGDFITVEANLPKGENIRIAFRFQSDNTLSDGLGAFIDNLCVIDAGQSGGDPAINSVAPVDGPDFFADTENRVVIEGANLTPLGQVSYTSPLGQQTLDAIEQSGSISVILPRLADPLQNATGTLQVTRADGAVSNTFDVNILAAPQPEISAIDPNVFPLTGFETLLTVDGQFFRPVFDGADDAEGSIIVARQGDQEIQFDNLFNYDERGPERLILDAFSLQSLDPGPVDIVVLNQYSGLESEPVSINLANTVEIDRFAIEVGPLGIFVFDPATTDYPLQRDQTFTLVWDGFGFGSNAFNVTINGVTYVENGQAPPVQEPGEPDDGIEDGDVAALISQTQAIVSFAPMVIDATGQLDVQVWNTGGAPQGFSFDLLDPLPPQLIDEDGDWNDQSLSAAEDNDIRVVGDNFRGLSIFGVNAETVTQVFLVPVGGGDEIQLPQLQPGDLASVSISPEFGGFNVDELIEPVAADTITAPTGGAQFGLRVLNPDSGLSVSSEPGQTIEFTP